MPMDLTAVQSKGQAEERSTVAKNQTQQRMVELKKEIAFYKKNIQDAEKDILTL